MFSGTISLENNGGFASARSPQDPGKSGEKRPAPSRCAYML